MDIRTQYTRKVLKESLIELLNEHRLHEITVKQLCGTAGVNKSTLYAHYADIYDLFLDAEHDYLKQIRDVSLQNSGAKNSEERKMHYINVCEFYRSTQKSLIAFYNSGFDVFLSRIAEIMENEIWYNPNNVVSDKEKLNRHLRMVYSNQGYMNVIYTWLTQYPNTPADEIADVLILERSGYSYR